MLPSTFSHSIYHCDDDCWKIKVWAIIRNNSPNFKANIAFQIEISKEGSFIHAEVKIGI